jgi:uncharacterized protein YcfJ
MIFIHSFCKRSALALAIAGSLGLHGCATLPGQESTTQVSSVARLVTTDYYPNCYQPVEELRRYDVSARMAKRQEEARTAGILAGAAIGAIAGAALDSGSRGRGALLGGLAGGLIGAMATAQQDQGATQQAAQDRSNLTDKYAYYIDGDVSDMDLTLASAQKAQSCYQKEYSKLLRDKKRGRVTAQEGRQRLTEIVAGLQETNGLIATVDSRFTENVAVYTRSYEETLQQSGLNRTQVASAAAPAKKPTKSRGAATPVVSQSKGATPAVSKEIKETEKKLQQAETKRVESRKVAQNGANMVRDICKNPDASDWAPADKCTA